MRFSIHATPRAAAPKTVWQRRTAAGVIRKSNKQSKRDG